MPEPFWSDTLDMDLPRILGDRFDAALGPAADITLWTHGHTSHGRLNHPAVWGHTDGYAAYFGTSNDLPWKPESYVTSHPLVECTWREVLRDAWPHTYIVIVDWVRLWDAHALARTFERLMYDLRGWKALPPGAADQFRGQVLASVIAATQHLERLVADGRKAVRDA
jgi:hypothetical protein